jgi:ubiquinone/menaquinone biosynthesis C-methylase UbiE
MIADLMFHDDQVADFGGNDGFAAYNFYMVHKVKPLVVDCSPARLEYAGRVFHLPTYETFIESMPELKDKQIDWAYSSHTIEHTREPDKALREIARVVKRQCLFVLPLESASHAQHRNHAHTCSFSTPGAWKKFMESCGWKVIRHARVGKHEGQFIAEPR